MSLEKKIQNKVVAYARQKGCLAFKVNVGSQRGWPDYLFIDSDGFVFFIEFKGPKGQLSPLQKYRLDQLNARGIKTYVVKSENEGLEIIDAMVSTRLPEESNEVTPESGVSGAVS